MAYPTLRTNEVIGALYNQIISIQTESKNVAGVYDALLNSMKIEGSMYGDTKVYIDTDVLRSYEFAMDEAHGNVLKMHRGPLPKTQTIVIDQFRQVAISVDQYMTKRAFADEGSFSSFNGVIRSWVGETKKIYDATTFNTFIGTETSDQADITVDVSEYPSVGQGIATELANAFIKLGDVSRDYNDHGVLRSYDANDLIVVWNAKYVNEVKKIDLPALFHKDGLIEKFEDFVLPERYFGTIKASSGTVTTVGPRTLVEVDYNVDGQGKQLPMDAFDAADPTNPLKNYDPKKHLFPGDVIPAGKSYAAGEAYDVDDDIICIIMSKGSVPFMSSFTVGTSWFNSANLVENQYLTWSRNSLEHLKGKPFIRVKAI